MNNKQTLDLIRSSSESIVLIDVEGQIVANSLFFEHVINTKLPFEPNFYEMLMFSINITDELKSVIRRTEKLNFDKEYKIEISENIFATLKAKSTLTLNGRKLTLVSLKPDTLETPACIIRYINSNGLFYKVSKPSLIYNIKEDRVLSFNVNAKALLRKYYKSEGNDIPIELKYFVKNLSEKAKIGGKSSFTKKLTLNKKEYSILFNCTTIDVSDHYYLITFKDVTSIIDFEENRYLTEGRLDRIIRNISCTIFEFSIKNKVLSFNFISPGIKDIAGISAENIVKKPEIFSAMFSKHERAKVELYFMNINNEESSINNIFKLTNYNKEVKWIKIESEIHKQNTTITTATGRILDITNSVENKEKEKFKIKRDNYIYYFELELLKFNNIKEITSNLVHKASEAFGLQNFAIYLLNNKGNTLSLISTYNSFITSKSKSLLTNKINTDNSKVRDAIFNYKTKINNTDKGSEIVVPIICDSHLLGVIISTNFKLNFFDGNLEHLLGDLSNTLGSRITRLMNKKNNDNNLRKISNLYKNGKIFNFEYNTLTHKLNNNAINNLINLFGIEDKEERLEIYRNTAILGKYYSEETNNEFRKAILNAIENFGKSYTVEAKVKTNVGEKWTRSIFKISESKNKSLTVNGTIQEITNSKLIKDSYSNAENLMIAFIKSQLHIQKSNDYSASLGIVGEALNVSRILISEFDIENGFKYKNSIRWSGTKELSDQKDNCFIKQFREIDYQSILDKEYVNFLKEDLTKEQQDYFTRKKVKSILSFPLKSINKTWGLIHFIEEVVEDRDWKVYEKKVLKGFSAFIALKLQTDNLINQLKNK